jgi:hypothetical protein
MFNGREIKVGEKVLLDTGEVVTLYRSTSRMVAYTSALICPHAPDEL